MPEMTNAEMDAAVAVEVMGRRVALLGDNMYYFSIDGVEITLWRSDWRPTTDLNQAFEVAKAMGILSMYLDLRQDAEFWRAGFYNMTGNLLSWSQDASAARAICEAALAAKRGENG